MESDTSLLSGPWTRRDFLRGAAGVVAVPNLQLRPGGFAFVASGTGAIHSYCISGNRWTLIQTVPTPSPACVLLDAGGRTLYVANDVDEHESLSRGTVESFAVGVDGRLTWLQRRALSLSATHPQHMALSPDGKLLAVASYGGGIYNLLPVERGGTLGSPSGIFKETGCGVHPELQASAHPHAVCFDTSGRYLLASDLGTDRLSVFGIEEGRLARRSQRSTGAGSGPGAFVLHPREPLLYALHGLEERLAVYRVEEEAIEPVQLLSLEGSTGALAIHPSGGRLYTGHEDGLQIWTTGRARLSPNYLPMGTVNSVTVTEDAVYACAAAQGSICRIDVDSRTGDFGATMQVAELDAPRSIALRSL